MRDTVKKNCNTCRCEASAADSRCMELFCEERECAVDDVVASELRRGFDSGQYTWSPANAEGKSRRCYLALSSNENFLHFRPRAHLSVLGPDAGRGVQPEAGHVQAEGACECQSKCSPVAATTATTTARQARRFNVRLSDVMSCRDQSRPGLTDNAMANWPDVPPPARPFVPVRLSIRATRLPSYRLHKIY